MSSLVEDYSYDIFISYRQKDNKYDGWVSTFVENLKLELEATFKQDISVYFDMNPVDGILESNEVSDSLKNKLKCMIFIPILSQTYCDTNSFAFEKEFKEFVTQASHDKLGLKVKHANGNVTSRVLPVRINELSSEDVNLFESIIGGQLRGIDFIYRSYGVNRPLRHFEDHPQDNLNKTYYRDQINKVAQSIRDIILSAKGDYKPVELKNEDFKNKKLKFTQKFFIIKFLAVCISVIAILTILVFLPNRINSQDVLNRTINHYDYYGDWKVFEGKLHLTTLFVEGDLYEEIIEIRVKENYYKNTIINKDTIISGKISGKYFFYNTHHLNPDPNIIDRPDSLNIEERKQHHYWHFGGVMFLKNSGMALNKKVVKTTFLGKKSLMISFTSDTTTSYWNVFIEPNSYSILGYKMKDGLFKNELTVVCQGEFSYDRIKIPMFKFYYNNAGNIMFVNLFHIKNQ